MPLCLSPPCVPSLARRVHVVLGGANALIASDAMLCGVLCWASRLGGTTGIPGYNWLSDDEHGVRGWDSTYFPDGPGLGASFNKQLLYAVGKVVGSEARAKHNYLTHTTGMRDNAFNGDGITVYGPNMNLVKDPRWGCVHHAFPHALPCRPFIPQLLQSHGDFGAPPSLGRRPHGDFDATFPWRVSAGVPRKSTRRTPGCRLP